MRTCEEMTEIVLHNIDDRKYKMRNQRRKQIASFFITALIIFLIVVIWYLIVAPQMDHAYPLEVNGVKYTYPEVEWERLAWEKEDLPQVSDLIVVFTPQTYSRSGYGYTITTGTVQQVLKGEMAVGDEIKITESCEVFNDGAKVSTTEGYLLTKQSESYLLFLKAYEADSGFAGMYYPIDFIYGKYVLDADTGFLSSLFSDMYAELQIGYRSDLEKYTQWYEYVRSLYPEVFA